MVQMLFGLLGGQVPAAGARAGSLKSPRYPQNCRRWVLQHGLSWEPPSFGFLSKNENDVRLEEPA